MLQSCPPHLHRHPLRDSILGLSPPFENTFAVVVIPSLRLFSYHL